MKMNFSLDLTLSQKLNLTKELKQSLEILQMNRFELEALIYNEVSENPTLDVEKKDEIDWERYLKDLSEHTYKTSGSYYESAEDDRVQNPENYIAEKENFYDYLKNQLSFCDLSREVFHAACYIIRTLDKDGYFREEVESAANNAKVELEVFLEALSVVQGLEPTGIGARSIEECMLLQLDERGCSDEVLRAIISEDIEKIATRKYGELCKKYRIDDQRLKEYLVTIRSLEPRPAREISDEDSGYILPDVIVEKTGSDFVARLNIDSIPNLRINRFYQNLLKENTAVDAKDYIKEKLNRSVFLMRTVEQRKNTILKVAQQIVEEQKEFLNHGREFMKSMVLRDIAEKTGFHESTISRTVNGKYMLTPRGIYEFKFFFTSGVSGEDGEMVSHIHVKERIRQLIDQESKKKPMSDQRLCDILNSEGINISRRTVAKYREEEGIPSSASRKEI